MSAAAQHVVVLAFDRHGLVTVMQGDALDVVASETERHGHRPGVDPPGAGGTTRLTIRWDEDGYEHLIGKVADLEVHTEATSHHPQFRMARGVR